MRPIVVFIGLCFPTALAAAEPFPTLPNPIEEVGAFQLGGASSRTALTPEIEFNDTDVQRQRLALPAPRINALTTQQETALGPAILFFGDSLDSGREAVQMGTFLQRGQTRAGVSVTILEEREEVSRSELFVDYSLTSNFSVGVSGILNTELDENETVPQLGLSAEYSTDGGAYLQGGVADAVDFDPVIGVSIGLRF